MKWWPHNQPVLTSTPVVVACCMLVGLAVAFTSGLPTQYRPIVFVAGPTLCFSFFWVSVALSLRIFGHSRAVALLLFYFGLLGIVAGLTLAVAGYLGVSSMPREQIAVGALSIAGYLGMAVAAKRSLGAQDLSYP